MEGDIFWIDGSALSEKFPPVSFSVPRENIDPSMSRYTPSVAFSISDVAVEHSMKESWKLRKYNILRLAAQRHVNDVANVCYDNKIPEYFAQLTSNKDPSRSTNSKVCAVKGDVRTIGHRIQASRYAVKPRFLRSNGRGKIGPTY